MLEHFVFLREVLVKLENGSNVTTSAIGHLSALAFIRHTTSSPVAVIRCTPYSYNGVIKHEFVPFHCELMGSGNQVYGIIVRK